MRPITRNIIGLMHAVRKMSHKTILLDNFYDKGNSNF